MRLNILSQIRVCVNKKKKKIIHVIIFYYAYSSSKNMIRGPIRVPLKYGAYGTRTRDPNTASVVRSQLR